MQKMTLQAPAKLNLTLDITGLAPNGYHTLDMVMQTVSLYDAVSLTPADGLTVTCPPSLPADERNIALKAAMQLRKYVEREQGARIGLGKNIPMQAGLGGGSADAAAVLKGLNDLWGLGLDAEELGKIGLGLGSDVPFALAGGAARVRGTGDMIESLDGNGTKSPKPPLWFLVAKPEGGVNTAEAYHLYDLLAPVRNLETTATRKRPDNDRFVEALQAGDIEGMAKAGGNALERAAVHLLPVIGKLIEEMKATGAGYCAMTGSGSAVFGMFASEMEARKAQIKLIGSYWTAVVHAC